MRHRACDRQWQFEVFNIERGWRRFRKKKETSSSRGLKIWNDEIEQLATEKKMAYLKLLECFTLVNTEDYKKKCAIVKREVRKLSSQHWDSYISERIYSVGKEWRTKH